VGKYLAAARGLHAAHQRDIVHRDFKADNVLVGADGRVFVVDFGLARRAGDAASEDARLDTLDSEQLEDALSRAGLPTGSGSLDALTRTGAVMGTPAYMPPETYLGRPPDARSDQFSFCVALYEALYGEHPFAAGGAAALAYKVLEGEVADPPEGTDVPAWIRAPLLRGMLPRSGDRFPDMAALAQALERDPTQGRRRRLLATAGVVGATGIVALAIGLRGPTPDPTPVDPCLAAGSAAPEAWAEDRANATRAHFVQTDPEVGPSSYQALSAAIEENAGAWSDGRIAVCRDAKSTGPSRLLDERIACYEDRLGDLRATIALLEQGDRKLVRKAPDVVRGLPSLRACEDADALLARVAPPEEATARAAVTKLRGELAEGRALRHAGKMPAAKVYLEERLPRAEELGYAPLTAEILDILGHVEGKLGELEAANDHLRAAVMAAERGGDDERAVRAMMELGYFEGWMNSRFEEGFLWLRLAEAKLDRLGPRPEIRSRIHYTRGAILTGKGDIDGAEAEFLRSGEIAEANFSRTHPRTIGVVTALGNIAFFRADYAEASRRYEDARARYSEIVGAVHPAVADLETNIGNVQWARKQYDEARASYQRALALYGKLFGPNDAAVLDVLSNLAAVEHDTHRYDEAMALYRRALKIVAESRGPDHVDGAVSHAGLGDAHFAKGEMEQALIEHEEALRLRRKTLGDGHPEVAGSETSVGRVLLELGRIEAALERFEGALEIKLKSGQESPNTAYTRTRIAEAQRRLGRTRQARKQLERALEEHEARPEPDAKSVGSTWFTFAKLEWDVGDRAASRAAAERAAEAYAGTESSMRGEVASWRASH
jgi:tetratricopeptide (TPR) repeat protein